MTKPGASSKAYTIHGTTGKSRADQALRKHQDEFNNRVKLKTSYCVSCLRTPRKAGSYPICPTCQRSSNA